MEKLKTVTIIDFWAPWCGPCKQLSPIVDQLISDYETNENVNILKINVDENPELAINHNIRGVPTLLFMHNNEVLDRLTGLQTKEAIVTKINTIISN